MATKKEIRDRLVFGLQKRGEEAIADCKFVVNHSAFAKYAGWQQDVKTAVEHVAAQNIQSDAVREIFDFYVCIIRRQFTEIVGSLADEIDSAFDDGGDAQANVQAKAALLTKTYNDLLAAEAALAELQQEA